MVVLIILTLPVSLCVILPGDYCEVNVCHNGATCVTGVGEDPFICICADGFGGDTCNLTETGRLDWKHSIPEESRGCWYIWTNAVFSSFLQDPAVLTPVRTMGLVKSSLRPDEEMFSMNTSADVSPALRECTARSVSFLLPRSQVSELTAFFPCSALKSRVYIIIAIPADHLYLKKIFFVAGQSPK